MITKIREFFNGVSGENGKNVIKYFPEGYEAKIYEIGNLPLYNADYDNEKETVEIPNKEVSQEYVNAISTMD